MTFPRQDSLTGGRGKNGPLGVSDDKAEPTSSLQEMWGTWGKENPAPILMLTTWITLFSAHSVF